MSDHDVGSRQDVFSDPPRNETRMRDKINLMSVSQVGLFVLASAYTIYLIRPVLLPLILALLLTLVLKPVHRRIEAYLRFPSPLASLTVILVFSGVVVVGIAYLSQPVIKYSEDLRGDLVKERLAKVFMPLTEIQGEIAEVAREVEAITNPDPSKTDASLKRTLPRSISLALPTFPALPPPFSPEAIEVVVTKSPGGDGEADSVTGSGLEVKVLSEDGEMSVTSDPDSVRVESDTPPVSVQIREDPMEQFYAVAQDFSFHLLVTLALAFFFLAFGDTMLARLAEVDAAEVFLHDLTEDISFYLFMISVINTCLGIAIGIGMWLLGMPNPILWGVMAALLNFIPYIGAIAGTAMVFLVAAISFDQTSQIIPVPIVYYLLTAIEGNFITPTVIGHRFTINPIIVFVWVLSWGAMWGIAGMLIGLPLLMVFRIVCAKMPGLSRVERVISV